MNQVLKPSQIFECSCADGFVGDFCEFKTEQDHLLYVHGDSIPISLVFDRDGRLIEENDVIDEQTGIYGSCSTMLNGEAVIFGGSSQSFQRQVRFK